MKNTDMTNEEKADEIMATIQYRLTPEIVRQSLLAAMQWKDATKSFPVIDVEPLIPADMLMEPFKY